MRAKEKGVLTRLIFKALPLLNLKATMFGYLDVPLVRICGPNHFRALAPATLTHRMGFLAPPLPLSGLRVRRALVEVAALSSRWNRAARQDKMSSPCMHKKLVSTIVRVMFEVAVEKGGEMYSLNPFPEQLWSGVSLCMMCADPAL